MVRMKKKRHQKKRIKRKMNVNNKAFLPDSAEAGSQPHRAERARSRIWVLSLTERHK